MSRESFVEMRLGVDPRTLDPESACRAPLWGPQTSSQLTLVNTAVRPTKDTSAVTAHHVDTKEDAAQTQSGINNVHKDMIGYSLDALGQTDSRECDRCRGINTPIRRAVKAQNRWAFRKPNDLIRERPSLASWP